MKCYYHSKRNVVATCQNCSADLCKECVGEKIPCPCKNCIKLLDEQLKQNIVNKKEDYLIDSISELIAAILKE